MSFRQWRFDDDAIRRRNQRGVFRGEKLIIVMRRNIESTDLFPSTSNHSATYFFPDNANTLQRRLKNLKKIKISLERRRSNFTDAVQISSLRLYRCPFPDLVLESMKESVELRSKFREFVRLPFAIIRAGRTNSRKINLHRFPRRRKKGKKIVLPFFSPGIARFGFRENSPSFSRCPRLFRLADFAREHAIDK